MKTLCDRLVQSVTPEMPVHRHYRIGCLGSGFIMAECQLQAYQDQGFCVEAIASRTFENAQKVAERYGIRKVYQSMEELIEDPEIDIVDIALPPHIQKEMVRKCCAQKHIKGILCQKPLAVSIEDVREIAGMGRESGVRIAVNQNMRYDPSIRALKCALDSGCLGTPVLASIDLRAPAGVQPFFRDYGRFEILDLAIHHLDCFRYLFGEPDRIFAVCRPDPRTTFEHMDGLSEYILQYDSGLIANSIDDGYAGPDDPCASEHYINWRVEGTEGLAMGDVGWHEFPRHVPSHFKMATRQFPGEWIEPAWDMAWFPDAFGGTMADLMIAIEEDREPRISPEDHMHTMACVEACYRSVQEGRFVSPLEFLSC